MNTVTNNTLYFTSKSIIIFTKFDKVFFFFYGKVDWHYHCIFSNTSQKLITTERLQDQIWFILRLNMRINFFKRLNFLLKNIFFKSINLCLFQPMRLIEKLQIRLNSFMTEAVIIQKSMDWFLYDNGLRHERVKIQLQIQDSTFLKHDRFVMKHFKCIGSPITNKSKMNSHLSVFSENAVLKNFLQFTGKCLCQVYSLRNYIL